MQQVVDGLRVGVVHGPGEKVRPVWFDLNSRKHTIEQITNSWKERRGNALLIHFHVTDTGALYELVFNLSTTSWCLERIEPL